MSKKKDDTQDGAAGDEALESPDSLLGDSDELSGMDENEAAAYFVARCFHARNVAHAIHLSTRSLAEHLALADFYGAIVGMIDTYAETWQGAYDLLDGVIEAGAEIATDGLPESSQAFLQELGEWIREERPALTGGCPAFDNLIDPIINLIDQTIYKLRFLS